MLTKITQLKKLTDILTCSWSATVQGPETQKGTPKLEVTTV